MLYTIGARKVKVKVKQLKSYPIRNWRNMKSINIPSFVSWDRPPTKSLLKKGKIAEIFRSFMMATCPRFNTAKRHDKKSNKHRFIAY